MADHFTRIIVGECDSGPKVFCHFSFPSAFKGGAAFHEDMCISFKVILTI